MNAFIEFLKSFCIVAKEVFVIVTLDTKNISAVNITDINVFLSDVSKKDEIKSYLSELFLYSVNINIMKKGE